jgi:hypothetical protein
LRVKLQHGQGVSDVVSSRLISSLSKFIIHSLELSCKHSSARILEKGIRCCCSSSQSLDRLIDHILWQILLDFWKQVQKVCFQVLGNETRILVRRQEC